MVSDNPANNPCSAKALFTLLQCDPTVVTDGYGETLDRTKVSVCRFRCMYTLLRAGQEPVSLQPSQAESTHACFAAFTCSW